MGVALQTVRLLACSPGPETLVSTAARVCYSPDRICEIEETASADDNWIEKLMTMGHESPIEHATFTFGIEGVSRSLLAQITRHRIASFSVRSQRYVGEVKNGSTFDYVVPPSIKALGPAAEAEFCLQMAKIQEWYNGWVEALGGGRNTFEDARYVLPNAAATTIVATMNARELRHFFRVRCCQRAQWEIRSLADGMLSLAKNAAPHLFKGAGPACVTGPCPEGSMACGKAAEMREKYR